MNTITKMWRKIRLWWATTKTPPQTFTEACQRQAEIQQILQEGQHNEERTND